MARSYKKDPPKWWTKEKKAERKVYHRKYRHSVNQLLRTQLTDEKIEPLKNTEGWLSH